MSDAVLVTGAGGFVGSAVVRRLVNPPDGGPLHFSDGTPVRQIVALLRPGSSTERLRELHRTGSWSIEYADIMDRVGLGNLLTRIRPRVILHLAMDRAAYRDFSPEVQHRVHIAPLETLFHGLVGVPGGRLINTSSAWVLRAGDRLDEDAPVDPRSAYAENKLRVDRLLPILNEQTGVDWINLRLFNIFGPYESTSRLLPYLVARLTRGQVADLSSGGQIRDFNHVEAMADAYRAALAADARACGIMYHIGSGLGTTTRDFALMVAAVTGNAHLIRFGAGQTLDQDLPCLVADPSRARRLLKWVPDGNLEGRVRAGVEWWLQRLDAVRTAGSPRGPAAAGSMTQEREGINP